MATLKDVSKEERAAWGRLQMFLGRISEEMQKGEDANVDWMRSNAEIAGEWFSMLLDDDIESAFWTKLLEDIKRFYLEAIEFGLKKRNIVDAHLHTGQLQKVLEYFAELLGEEIPLEEEKAEKEVGEPEEGEIEPISFRQPIRRVEEEDKAVQ